MCVLWCVLLQFSCTFCGCHCRWFRLSSLLTFGNLFLLCFESYHLLPFRSTVLSCCTSFWIRSHYYCTFTDVFRGAICCGCLVSLCCTFYGIFWSILCFCYSYFISSDVLNLFILCLSQFSLLISMRDIMVLWVFIFIQILAARILVFFEYFVSLAEMQCVALFRSSLNLSLTCILLQFFSVVLHYLSSIFFLHSKCVLLNFFLAHFVTIFFQLCVMS